MIRALPNQIRASPLQQFSENRAMASVFIFTVAAKGHIGLVRKGGQQMANVDPLRPLLLNRESIKYKKFGGQGKKGKNREEEWTHSIALGSQPFVERVKNLLGIRAKGREVIKGAKGYQLREEAAGYQALFQVKNSDIGLDNATLWDINERLSIGWRGPTPIVQLCRNPVGWIKQSGSTIPSKRLPATDSCLVDSAEGFRTLLVAKYFIM